jgi:hypothetical protein
MGRGVMASLQLARSSRISAYYVWNMDVFCSDSFLSIIHSVKVRERDGVFGAQQEER